MRKATAEKVDEHLKAIKAILAEDDAADMVYRRAHGHPHNLHPVVDDEPVEEPVIEAPVEPAPLVLQDDVE